jgi:hypothetical protein
LEEAVNENPSFSSLQKDRHVNATFRSTKAINANYISQHNEKYQVQHDPPSKPLFVMHIGPVKTGTTTLQCALQSLAKNLEADGFIVAETESCRPENNTETMNLTWTKGGVATYDNVVLGKSFAPNCLAQHNENSTGMPDCWMESYAKYAQEQLQLNHSIIISNEIISQVTSKLTSADFVDDLVDSLPGYRVVIVVTYRPWFSWIASLQDQTTKNFMTRPRDWPGEGKSSRKLESMQIFAARQLKYRRRNKISSKTYPFVDDAIQIFANHSRLELKIINIHDEGDLVTNFVCKTLVGATDTCNSLKSGNTTLADKNKAENKLWYDMLAVEAHEQGLVSKSRLAVYKRIQNFQEKTLGKSSTDFPKSCPSQSFLKRVLKESLQTEKKIYPQQYKKFERKHRKAFARAIQSEKFCTINATRVLEDKQWRNLFKRLKRRKKRAK